MKKKKKFLFLILFSFVSLFLLFTLINKDKKEDDALNYLGISKEEMISVFGNTDYYYDVPGSGGTAYAYYDEGIVFIFADENRDIVNNLILHEGVKVAGIEVGMTLKEIEDVLGEPFRKGYDENLYKFGKNPWYGEYYITNKEIEIRFYSKEEDSPALDVDVFWRGYWR
jgi:hypothetical protein